MEEQNKISKIDKLIPDKIKKHIPNTITVGRVLMALGFISSFLTGNIVSAISLFACASISDAVDGYLARKWNVQSKFGKYLDPFADKLLVGSALLLYGTINPVMYITLIGELSIASINIFSMIKNKKVDVNKEGKLKTILLMTTVSLALLSTPFNNTLFNKLISFLVLFNIPFQGATFTGYVEQLLKVSNYESVNNEDNNQQNNDEINNDNKIENNELNRNDKIKYLKNEMKFLTEKNNFYSNKEYTFKKHKN